METDTTLMEIEERFILHWGEMGSRWGINRTVAQTHALLYLSDQPLHAQEISDRLHVARSNISTSLKELQSWNLIRVVHERGDRRDYFEAMTDVWEMFTLIIEERKRREFDPTLALMQEMKEALSALPRSPRHALLSDRIARLFQFLKLMDGFYSKLRSIPSGLTKRLFRLDKKLQRQLESMEDLP